MHTSLDEARALAVAVVAASNDLDDRDVMIAPPSTALSEVAGVVADSNVILSSQNVHWAVKGAFTGEISPLMLKDIGCKMAIIGHSERRHVFFETDELINKRIQGAIENEITPVFCIGETLSQREEGKMIDVLEGQVWSGLENVSLHNASQLVVAYEPVWAIGTGKTATENQAQEVHAYLRDLLGNIFEKNIAAQMRILYGGSVKPENIDILMQQDDIDGVLVGGAALEADSFERIIRFHK